MKESTKKSLDLVLKTLDQISVVGKANMDMLLGCILTLEGAIKDEEQKEEAAEE